VIELDGAQHLDDEKYDRQRSEYLAGLGYRVVRFWDNDAFANIDEVVEQISNLLKDPHPPRASRGGLSAAGARRLSDFSELSFGPSPAATESRRPLPVRERLLGHRRGAE